MLLSVTEQLVKISWKHLARNATFWLLEQVLCGTLNLIGNLKLTTNYLLTSALNVFNKIGHFDGKLGHMFMSLLFWQNKRRH